MRSPGWRCLLLLLLPGPIAGCQPSATGGSLTADWVGLDTGRVEAAPRAIWCVGDQRLELTAEQGDAGVGLALYPLDSLVSGEYPAFDQGADTIHRPGVAAGVRWFTESAVRGYQGDSGGLTLTREGERMAGRFSFRLRSLEGSDTVRMTGQFSGARAGACPADTAAAPDSTR